ncbi:hypothetical protein [Kineococcus arenarius]|uniref:hypothetical protein n=1 Tax=Kineococcus sp. SYSU DK007 TaxID=3383128 RepID=UPI003D7C7C41
MTPTTAAVPEFSNRRPSLGGALARRWPTVLGALAAVTSFALIAQLPEHVQAWISAWCVLLAALIYLTWGTARGDLGDLGDRRMLSAQSAAVLAFGAVAITASAVDLDVARYVLAAGWLAHAAWDLAHHRLGRVVPRWYAETCLIADLTIAAALLTVGLD